MDKRTIESLVELNKQFYQIFASSFSSTRQRLQPGVQRVIESLPAAVHILDVGCGNGELVCELIRRGHNGSYVGLDFSDEMIFIAREAAQKCIKDNDSLDITFEVVDLSKPGWGINLPCSPYAVIFAFASMHHLPGVETRRNFLEIIHENLITDGQFIHSEWQFLNSARLRDRIQPWRMIGLREEQVDAGDYLLDWRHGGTGVRYIHHFSKEELTLLAAEHHFRVTDTFLSDGEGGKLGLYQIWVAH